MFVDFFAGYRIVEIGLRISDRAIKSSMAAVVINGISVGMINRLAHLTLLEQFDCIGKAGYSVVAAFNGSSGSLANIALKS